MTKPNVILIVLDAARPDRMSCYGYKKRTTPNLEKIVAESTIFKNAFSNAPWTLPSHASMFTGLYPTQHGATHESHKINDNVVALAEILSGKGYKTLAISENDGWISNLSGLTKGFHSFFGNYDIYSRHLFPIGNGRIKRLLQYPLIFLNKYILDVPNPCLIADMVLKKLKTTQPFFMFVNFLECHLPYFPSKKFRQIFLKEEITRTFYKNWPAKRIKQWRGEKGFTKRELTIMNALYDASMFSLDQSLGKIFNYMKDSGIIDDTLLIITSDHGENIGHHGLVGHQFSLHDSLLKVPLIVRYPRLFPKRFTCEKIVDLRKIFFTILHSVGDESDTVKDESLFQAVGQNYQKQCIFGEYYTPTNTLKLMKGTKLGAKYKGKNMFIRNNEFKYIYHENSEDEFFGILGCCEKKINPKHNLEEFNKMRNKLLDWERKEVKQKESTRIKKKIQRLKTRSDLII